MLDIKYIIVYTYLKSVMMFYGQIHDIQRKSREFGGRVVARQGGAGGGGGRRGRARGGVAAGAPAGRRSTASALLRLATRRAAALQDRGGNDHTCI